MAWAVISFFCGRYGREKGYSFWFSFLLCLLGQLIGLLAVLLLPDIARIRADAVGRDRAQDQEIATLKARLAVLESGSGTPAGRNDLSEVRLPPGLIFLPLWDNLATKTFFNCEVAHHE